MAAKKKTNLRKRPEESPAGDAALALRVEAILDEAAQAVVRTVNTVQVAAYWLVGREIVETEQGGERRAGYGKALLKGLAQKLHAKSGRRVSVEHLTQMRAFYLAYPLLLEGRLPSSYTPCTNLAVTGKSCAARTESEETWALKVMDAAPPTWTPGRLHPNLAWSHYRLLMRVEKPAAREFYEQECLEAGWKVRELERQIGSLYYERLLMSKNRKKMILENRKPSLTPHAAAALEVIKDPYVLEFLGLPEHHRLNETDLETKLVGQLQDFLMELGQGFAFIGRQQRLTLEGDHFYADLVFYHTRLKCYVVVDLKTKKLTHADLGQMQLYVNYYDEEIAAQDDNPTLGLILCTDKNEAVCKYVLGKGNQSIFTSRYQLHLPTEEQLATELRRELAAMQGGKANHESI